MTRTLDTDTAPAARVTLWQLHETRAALLFLAAITLFRLFYAALTGLANDETHYWQWSRYLALSYYDQGPGIAYLIRFGRLLFGDTSLGVRFGTVCLAAGTCWLIYATVARWLGARVALWTLCLATVSPILAIGGIIATYDGPQVFFWAAALYAVTHTVQTNRPAGWYAVGILVGLGALCKLTMWLFAPCVLAFLLFTPAYRRHLFTPHPYLGMLTALVVFSPVLIWSQTHGFTSVLHASALSSRGHGVPALRLFGDFLGGQAIVLGPLLFLAELWALVRLILAYKRWTNGERFAVWFCAPVLLVCFIIAVRSKMEANWAAPAHLMGLACLSLWFAGRWEANRAGARVGIAVSAALSFVLTAIILFPQIIPGMGFRVTADLSQKANETYGWQPMADAVQAARVQLEAEGKPVFLAGINYRVPSQLAYFLPDKPTTHELFFDTRRDQYYFWTRPETLIGQNCLLVADSEKSTSIDLARRYFASVIPLGPVSVTRAGFTGSVHTWHLYACRDFKGYDKDAHLDGW